MGPPMTPILATLRHLLEGFWARILSHGTGRWLLLGGIVGILCGVAGFIFELAVNLVSLVVLGNGVGMTLHLEGPWVPQPSGVDFRVWLIPPFLMIGGALSGWLSGHFAHDAAGGGTGIAVAGDVSTMEGGAAPVQAAIDTYGSIDGVVCVAGILRERMLFNARAAIDAAIAAAGITIP